MIKVNKYQPEAYDHYDPQGKYIGTLNEYEHVDLRIQIAEQNVAGYAVEFEGRLYLINDRGDIIDRPIGLFDKMAGLYRRSVKARFSDKNHKIDLTDPESLKKGNSYADIMLEHLKFWYNYGREVNLNPEYRKMHSATKHLIESYDGPQN
jgi:hypothetical protein